jgi:alanine racemase
LQRPTWAEVNLDALQFNVAEIKRLAPGASVLAVIKADAYGHGADAVAREIEPSVAMFGTATVFEAISLRQAGVETPILVLGGMTPEQLPVLHAYDFMPVVHNVEFWNALLPFTKALGREIAVHLKVDTGMGRLGLAEDEAVALLSRGDSGIRVDGLMTHFACADIRDDHGTLEQLRRFKQFVAVRGNGIPWIHAANSAAVLNYPEAHFNLVRPGLLLYGLSPMDEPSSLTPAMTLLSRIVALRWIHAGESIGYGRTFTAQRDTLIATLPIGYSDGLRRRLSNRLYIEVRGHMAPLVGAISMDLCMADVTEIAREVQLYDVATFIGPHNTAWDWARILNSIAWETFCLLGSRVPRVYKRGGEIVDVYYP